MKKLKEKPELLAMVVKRFGAEKLEHINCGAQFELGESFVIFSPHLGGSGQYSIKCPNCKTTFFIMSYWAFREMIKTNMDPVRRE